MKQLRKAKVIVVVSLTMVMLVAMTGLVAASPCYNFVYGYVTDGGSPVSGATVKAYVDDNILSGTPLGEDTTDGAGYYDICFDGTVVDPPYIYVVKDGATAGAQSFKEMSYVFKCAEINIYRGDIDIPEFASIAIPAGAILGLFLFSNHHKRKRG